jgi:hypothetical protein
MSLFGNVKVKGITDKNTREIDSTTDTARLYVNSDAVTGGGTRGHRGDPFKTAADAYTAALEGDLIIFQNNVTAFAGFVATTYIVAKNIDIFIPEGIQVCISNPGNKFINVATANTVNLYIAGILKTETTADLISVTGAGVINIYGMGSGIIEGVAAGAVILIQDATIVKDFKKIIVMNGNCLRYTTTAPSEIYINNILLIECTAAGTGEHTIYIVTTGTPYITLKNIGLIKNNQYSSVYCTGANPTAKLIMDNVNCEGGVEENTKVIVTNIQSLITKCKIKCTSTTGTVNNCIHLSHANCMYSIIRDCIFENTDTGDGAAILNTPSDIFLSNCYSNKDSDVINNPLVSVAISPTVQAGLTLFDADITTNL